MNSRKIKAALAIVIAASGILAEAIFGFMACAVKIGSTPTDGLGRVLSPTPTIMKFIFSADRLWAGPWWFAADIIIGTGGLVLFVILGLHGLSEWSETANRK